MTIFAWILLALSGLLLLLAIPTILKSNFITGLISLAANGAMVFYFASYLFFDIGNAFAILTYVLLATSALTFVTLFFSKEEGTTVASFFYLAYIVFFVLQLM